MTSIDYLDMAMEDGDASFAADIEKQYNDLLRDIEKAGSPLCSYPASTTTATPSSPSTPVPAERKPKTGRRC